MIRQIAGWGVSQEQWRAFDWAIKLQSCPVAFNLDFGKIYLVAVHSGDRLFFFFVYSWMSGPAYAYYN